MKIANNMLVEKQGFSLIELMVVIAIIGILASIAVPSYRNYVIKARISEGFGMCRPLQARLEEFYAANSRFPDVYGSDPPWTGSTIYGSSQWVSAIRYWGSAGAPNYAPIEIWYQNDTSLGAAAGKAFMLTGQADPATGAITWKCVPYGSWTVPASLLPAGCS